MADELATVDDVRNLGASRHGAIDEMRVTGLINSVSNQVCSYLSVTADDLLDALSDVERGDLASFVAEIAARRIQSPASPTSDPVAGDPLPWMTSRLTERDKAHLLEIPGIAVLIAATRPGTTFGSVQMTASSPWMQP